LEQRPVDDTPADWQPKVHHSGLRSHRLDRRYEPVRRPISRALPDVGRQLLQLASGRL